jgi:hypothetical protein
LVGVESFEQPAIWQCIKVVARIWISMPFTLSHPAASVPFIRSGLILSALVVGSIAPDIPYYLPLFPYRAFGHTLPGFFLFCVPAGMVVLWAFHALLKTPLIALLPSGHQKRLAWLNIHFAFKPLKRFVVIVISLLVGSATHILWDSFTHRHGFMVLRSSLLIAPLITFEFVGITIHVYEFLQYISTLLGAALIIYWYMSWYRKAPTGAVAGNIKLSYTTKMKIVAGIAIVAILAALLGGLLTPTPSWGLNYLRTMIVRMIVVGISVFMSGLLVYSACWHLTNKQG